MKTCYYCPKTEDLLPVGPERASICESCSSETPERKAASLPYMEEIMRRGQMMAMIGMLAPGMMPPRLRGLGNPQADRSDCIGKFVLDNGLDPENPDHEERAMDFDMGINVFAQGSLKPEGLEGTEDICAGWQAMHDTIIKRCEEQAAMDGYPVQKLYDKYEREVGHKLHIQEGATK